MAMGWQWRRIRTSGSNVAIAFQCLVAKSKSDHFNVLLVGTLVVGRNFALFLTIDWSERRLSTLKMTVQKRRNVQVLPSEELDLNDLTESVSESCSEASSATETQDYSPEADELFERATIQPKITDVLKQLFDDLKRIYSIPSIKITFMVMQYVSFATYFFRTSYQNHPVGRVYYEQVNFTNDVMSKVFMPGNDKYIFEKTIGPFFENGKDTIFNQFEDIFKSEEQVVVSKLLKENWLPLLHAVVFLFTSWSFSIAIAVAKLPAAILISFGFGYLTLSFKGLAFAIFRSVVILTCIVVIAAPLGLLEVAYIVLALFGVDWFYMFLITVLGKHVSCGLTLMWNLLLDIGWKNAAAILSFFHYLPFGNYALDSLKPLVEKYQKQGSSWMMKEEPAPFLPWYLYNGLLLMVALRILTLSCQRLAFRRHLVKKFEEQNKRAQPHNKQD
ncbi:unnamed protein product [Bursaphelenchus okinawaensis]|uniref:Uncharacterized protein n=1 Tax=Bursaphelenchus okinawaensis TaxID=465554 RepID=A0A811LRE2_9BILA|nr:unnamed protein product [Bursaphelenchus okinawaensis]CAG9128145.1 unnamed protein product [Bursaphelenchus okinawaensis]